MGIQSAEVWALETLRKMRSGAAKTMGKAFTERKRASSRRNALKAANAVLKDADMIVNVTDPESGMVTAIKWEKIQQVADMLPKLKRRKFSRAARRYFRMGDGIRLGKTIAALYNK